LHTSDQAKSKDLTYFSQIEVDYVTRVTITLASTCNLESPTAPRWVSDSLV